MPEEEEESMRSGDVRAALVVTRRLLLGSAMDSNYIGEPLSKASHMIQAARRARARNHSGAVVLACLFHDVGHLLAEDDTGGYGVSDHARLGAALLRGLGFGERTCRAVELHADAKRYLVGGDPFYALTPASSATLEHQGGPMLREEERVAFEADPGFFDALAVRSCDDTGKSRDLSPRQAARAFRGFEQDIVADVGRGGE